MPFEIKSGFFRRRERPWDIGMIPRERIPVFKNRIDPIGFEHEVHFDRAGKIRYPWANMRDGDFFIAMVGDRSKHAMEVAFRQAAARHDIEVAIHPGTIDGFPCYRVTRVCGNIVMVKRRARGYGVFAPSHDVEARRRRDRGDGPRTPGDAADALPTPSGSTDGPYDRAALLARARAAASEELE